MDYKKIMEEQKVDFPSVYDEAINNLAINFGLDDGLRKKLSNKRDFGLEKYKEYSFQASFENAIKVPTLEHLEEELVDAFNYVLHEVYKSSLKGENSNKHLEGIIANIKSAWLHLQQLK